MRKARITLGSSSRSFISLSFGCTLLLSVAITLLWARIISTSEIKNAARITLLSANASAVNISQPVPNKLQIKPVTDNHQPIENWQSVQMRVTAYCPCSKCCGEYADGTTACGHKIQPGEAFVAADKRYLFGTEMIIAGYNDGKPVKVLDRGGAIGGNRLDIFFASHQEALEWGVKYLDVKIRSR